MTSKHETPPVKMTTCYGLFPQPFCDRLGVVAVLFDFVANIVVSATGVAASKERDRRVSTEDKDGGN